MDRLIQLRSKIAEHNETLYLAFLLPMVGLVSIGLGSYDTIYLIIFFLCCIVLGVKLLCTDYDTKEWIVLILIGGLLLVNFFHNRERALFMTFLAVVGAKGIDVDRAVKLGLWERVILTAGKMGLCAVGILPNPVTEPMTKFIFGQYRAFEIHTFGYTHPNQTFWNIFTIGVLAVVVYRNTIRWWGYVVINLMMFGAYELLHCRTGFYTWILFMGMVLLYRLAVRIKLDKPFIYLLNTANILIPAVIFGLVIRFKMVGKSSWGFIYQLNQVLTGRLEHSAEAVPALFCQIIGHSPQEGFDIGYAKFLYNYGWILFIALTFVYLVAAYRLAKNNEGMICVAFVAMSLYLVGEMMPLNASWNLTLLYIAPVVLGRREKKNEK